MAAVDLADQIGPAVVEDLGAVLEAEKIALYIEIARLDLRSHRAVAQHDAVGEVVEEMRHRGRDACEPKSSPLRKRGSRATHRELAALDSRFRGNDGRRERLKRFRITPPLWRAWGRARRAGGRSRRAGRRGSACRNGTRARRWPAAGGIARRSARRRPAGGYRDRRRGRRNARPSRLGSKPRRPLPCASAARNW